MEDIFTDTKLIRELIHMDFPEIEPEPEQYDSETEESNSEPESEVSVDSNLEPEDSNLEPEELELESESESEPEQVSLEKVLEDSAVLLKELKDDNYAEIVKVINEHIRAFAQFVNNTYFEQIYSEFKTESEMKVLKDLSQTVFEITDSDRLVKFVEFAKTAEKIMNETDGLPRFGKSFSECFVWHVENIIKKLDEFIASESI